jgi:hypothetical protein
LNDYASLRGLRIGYVLESVYFQPFDSDKALDKVGVSNEQQLLEMLALGRIDALVGTDCQVDYSLLDPKLAGRIVKAAYQPQARTELYIGFSRKRLERMPELAACARYLAARGLDRQRRVALSAGGGAPVGAPRLSRGCAALHRPASAPCPRRPLRSCGRRGP